MLYRLLRDDGRIECEGDARNEDDALAVLGRLLAKTLTFDGPTTGSTYLLQGVEANQVGCRSREGRAVYVIDPSSN